MVKIGLILDTNIIKDNDGRRNICDQLNIFTQYIADYKKCRKKDKAILRLFLTEVSVDEYLEQKKQKLREGYDAFANKYRELLGCISGSLPESKIDEVINEEKEQVYDAIEVLSLSTNKELLDKLINDAICKNPPFDKTKQKGKTDSGFKDALIWNTVLQSKEIDEFDSVYFISGDGVFEDNKEELEKEFRKAHSGVKINIYKPESDDKKRQNALLYVINKEQNLLESDVIELYNYETIGNFIRTKIKYEKIIFSGLEVFDQQKLKSIYFEGFKEDDFSIDLVEKRKGDEYKISIGITTKKYGLEGESDIDYKKTLFGELDIVLRRISRGRYVFVSNSNVRNIMFGYRTNTLQDSLAAISQNAINISDFLNNLSAQLGEPISQYNNALKIAAEHIKNAQWQQFDISSGIINAARSSKEH